MGQQNDDRRVAEDKSVLRGLWTQTGQERRRSSQEAGTGKGQSSCLSERRGGACHPQRVQQSPARGRRAALARARFYGPKPLQLPAAPTRVLLVLLLAGACTPPKHSTASTSPPTG